MNANTSTALPYLFSQQRRDYAVEGSEQSGCKIIDPHPHCGIVLQLHPGVSAMKIEPLGKMKPTYLPNIHRLYHGMHRVLVLEVLIKIACAATVLPVACPKVNASF
jgi:hypothetical protein